MTKGKTEKLTEKKVKKIVRDELKDELERKHHYLSYSGASIDNITANFWQLCTPPQGLADNNRIGDTIKPVLVEIPYTIEPASVGPKFDIRIVVFQYTSPYTGTAPAFGSLFNSGYLGTGNSCNAPRNMDLLEQFHILYDKKHVVTLASGNKKGYIKIKAKRLKKIQFTAGSLYNCVNSLWFMAVSNDTSGAGSAYQPTLSFAPATFYTDA